MPFLIGVLAIGIYALSTGSDETFVRDCIIFSGIVIVCLLGILFGILGLFRSVVLHDNGLEIRSWNNSFSFCWDEVDSIAGCHPVIHRGATIHIGGPMKIGLTDGRSVWVAGPLDDHGKLASQVQDQVLALSLPVAVHDVQSGKMLKFGPLQADREGIWQGQKCLHWKDFDGTICDADFLMIQSKESSVPWAKVRLTSLTNSNLLVQLARTILRSSAL